MTKTDEALRRPEVRRVFEEELLFGEATDTVAGLLQSIGVSQKELARRLDLTEGRISQILSGANNLTLRSLAAVGWALGVRFVLHPCPMSNRVGTPAVDDPPLPEWLAALKTPDIVFDLKRTMPQRLGSDFMPTMLIDMPHDRSSDAA